MKLATVPISLIRENLHLEAVIAIVRGELFTLEASLDDLHPEEKNTYLAYAHAKRRHSYLLGRYSAKYALAELTGHRRVADIHIARGVFNFPVVKGAGLSNVQVSISHSLDVGLSIAFPEEHPMGVDTEVVDHERAEVVASQLIATEKKLLPALRETISETVVGFMFFSVKEALSKILRTGMMLDFKAIRISAAVPEHGWWRISFENFTQYQAYATHVNDRVYTLVLPAKTRILPSDLEKLLSILI